MDVQAIAFPKDAGLVWIRIGCLLDATVAVRPHEIVERIMSIPTGFLVETRDSSSGAAGFYQAPGYVISRVELLTEPRSEQDRLN